MISKDFVQLFTAVFDSLTQERGERGKKIPENTQTGLITSYSKHVLPWLIRSVNSAHTGIIVFCHQKDKQC